MNIITAVSSRLTGTGGRVSGSGRQSACHSLSETARASGVFFQPVLYGRIEQDNPGSDMAYQRLAFGLLKLGAERHHFDAQTQRGKRTSQKAG
ncbi:hypothetical protein IE990_21770 [Klebsiella pneumoniae]|uniref:Uncharacterized protein n=1 Tax=Klebsiella pneumoniae TaxID=573 RepID=A0A927DGW4_KLEPN|nr:hypothetical protein [Klebsiella pneumoniae]